MTAVAQSVSRTRRRGWFFVATSLAMLTVVALGFGRSFFLRPLYSSTPLRPHLVVHGVLMTAWFVLFIVQANLVRVSRVAWHRKVGWASMSIAVAAFLSGVYVNLHILGRAQHEADVEEARRMVAFASESLVGLLPFVLLIGAALWFIRKPAVHKRLMYWSFAWMLGPAFANSRPLGRALDALVVPHLPFFPSDVIWLVALLAYDWKSEGRPHPATLVPFSVLAVYVIYLAPLIAAHPALRAMVTAAAVR
jgi:hypothetical protein